MRKIGVMLEFIKHHPYASTRELMVAAGYKNANYVYKAKARLLDDGNIKYSSDGGKLVWLKPLQHKVVWCEPGQGCFSCPHRDCVAYREPITKEENEMRAAGNQAWRPLLDDNYTSDLKERKA